MQFFSNNHKLLILSAVYLISMPASFSQDSSLLGAPAFGLRNPLIGGAPMSLPFVSPKSGKPPAIGDGPIPKGVNPGMPGPPTLIPSHTAAPTNMGQCSNFNLPYDPNNQSRPGQLGPSMQVPAPPSTLGQDPGMIQTKPLYWNNNNYDSNNYASNYSSNYQNYSQNAYYGQTRSYRPPVLETKVNQGGGLSGQAPTRKWGGQTTRDWGDYKHSGTRTDENGQGMYWGQASQDGPFQIRAGAVPVQDLYGMRGQAQARSTVMTIAPY